MGGGVSAPWLPGLPPVGTICDVRYGHGLIYRNTRIVATATRGPCAMCKAVIGEGFIETPAIEGVEWRPIEVPDHA